MPVQDRESHREKDLEMLARVKEVDGDDDKMLVEYQQDIDIDIGIGAELPKLKFDQELKDCVEVPRRVLRRASPRESLRAWLRVQVCPRDESRFECGLECVLECVYTQSEDAVSWLWRIS